MLRCKTRSCRPMINKPPPFKGLNSRIPVIIPMKGRGFVNQGLGLVSLHPLIIPWDVPITGCMGHLEFFAIAYIGL